MTGLGFKAVVLEDAPDNRQTNILVITKEKAELIAASEYKNITVRATCRMLRDRFGEDVGVICVGPAGEMGMAGAGVATTDKSGVQIRFAGRGGMGAVMGSKGIKAVVFDDTGSTPGYRPPFKSTGRWLYAGDIPMVHLLDIKEQKITEDPTLEHFAMRASGLKGFLKTLKEMNISYRTVRVPKLRVFQIYISDPDGNNMHIDFPPKEADELGYD
jgi:hypothetical protein